MKRRMKNGKGFAQYLSHIHVVNWPNSYFDNVWCTSSVLSKKLCRGKNDREKRTIPRIKKVDLRNGALVALQNEFCKYYNGKYWQALSKHDWKYYEDTLEEIILWKEMAGFQISHQKCFYLYNDYPDVAMTALRFMRLIIYHNFYIRMLTYPVISFIQTRRGYSWCTTKEKNRFEEC